MSKRSYNSVWNSDKLLSISAIVLSLGTLVVFIYQTNLIRKHQYASVMPYLELGMAESGSPNAYYELENKGVGPALITDVKIHFKDQVFNESPVSFLKSNFRSMLDSIGPTLTYSAIHPGMLVPANSSVILFQSENSMVTADTIYQIFAEQVEIEITYQSIFEETWRVRAKHLTPLKLN